MAQTPSQIIEYRNPTLFSSASLTMYIDLAAQRTSQTCFGDNYGLAVALRAMHMFSLDSRAGGSGDAGTVSSKREGGLAVSYSQNETTGNASLSQTSFGLELLSLIKSNCVGISIVRSTRGFTIV